MDIGINSLLAAFASAFQQDRRLFQLRFTHATLDGELLPHTVTGDEQLSATFSLSVECLCADVGLKLKSLIGQGVDVAIQLSGGGERVLSGIVTGARQLGADGGFARYGLTVEPAFSVLALRRNSRVFQDKSVVDIVGLLLDEHIQHNPVFAQCFRHRAELTLPYARRSYCQQYRESDREFIERLLREEGISYRFEFAHARDQVGLHTLVLFDRGSALTAAAQSSIRFHRADATEADDTLTEWQASRQIRSGKVELARFDYKGVYTEQGEDRSVIDQGDSGQGLLSSLHDYDPQGLALDFNAAGGADTSDLNRRATLRQQAHDLASKTFSGSGVVRGMGAGQWFTLDDHPAHEADGESERQFVVTRQTFTARNNLPGEFKSLTGLLSTENLRAVADTDEPGYWNQIDAVRKTIPIVPAYSHSTHARPTAPGVQSATVVGPAGETLFTDALGRIKIQFHWARPQDHNIGTHGASADKNDFSSCWVRMAYPSAGASWGHQFIPRIGQEVLIDFIEGDIDRPVVIGVLYNGQHAPPTFSGAGSLPANKTLSGIKSQEMNGNRYNELLFDDTTHELRTKLSSEHGKTQLNLGYLIHPRSEGKGTPRGEGFELRSDRAGAIRAAQGLLISTEPQNNANGNQLDRANAKAQLEAAQNLTQQLSTTAQAQNANKPEPDPKLDTNHLEKKEAHLLLSGHGGIAITTPLSAALVTGTDLDQVAQRDTNQTSGRRWIHNVGESISIFVAGAQSKTKETLKLIAAKGNILIQSQSDDVEITADKKISLTACKENLTATAGQEFLLQSGGGYIRIDGGNIEIHCPGKLSMKAASFVHTSGSGETAQTPVLPVAAFMTPGAFVMAEAATTVESAATIGSGLLAPITAFVGGALYSPSIGGNQEKFSAPDGTVYTKHADEILYTATAQNGTKWTTTSPQDDIGYRTWLANGGNGSMQEWVADGRPSSLDGVTTSNSTKNAFQKLEREGHALARHGGPNRVTDSQLEDRALLGIDPASGTIYDAYNKNSDGSPKIHKVGKNATAFTNDQALIIADKFARKSNQFQQNIATAKENGDLFSDPVEAPLKDVFGSNYKDEVRGVTRLGSKANPSGKISTDFTDGTIKAIYRIDPDGSVNLHTLYPNPKQ